VSKKLLKKSVPFFAFFALYAASAFAQPQSVENGLGMRFVFIPPGSFMMGERNGATRSSDPDESPQHRVVISSHFYMQEREVTQSEWREVMGHNPAFFRGSDLPAEQVSWNDVMVFIERLNKAEGGNFYRLPTEAEWEYCARAGTPGFFWFGNDPKYLSDHAWNSKNSGAATRPVATKPKNRFGLHDVIGNVGEWTNDWYGENYYSESPFADPKGPETGFSKVIRGCSWADTGSKCRSAFRNYLQPADMNAYVGFRLVRTNGKK
jgi:formylglycine-generating enzyme required for sulfatase activity